MANKKRFSCGHRGLGKHCHRCEQAEKLEEMAAAGQHYADFKKLKYSSRPRLWTKEAMLNEAKRLRNEGRK